MLTKGAEDIFTNCTTPPETAQYLSVSIHTHTQAHMFLSAGSCQNSSSCSDLQSTMSNCVYLRDGVRLCVSTLMPVSVCVHAETSLFLLQTATATVVRFS